MFLDIYKVLLFIKKVYNFYKTIVSNSLCDYKNNK